MKEGKVAQTRKVGDVVTLRQAGTLQIGGMSLTDNVVEGVTVVAVNEDGTYQIDLRKFISAPGMDSVKVPADWLF
jgi:hypothetical protein